MAADERGSGLKAVCGAFFQIRFYSAQIRGQLFLIHVQPRKSAAIYQTTANRPRNLRGLFYCVLIVTR
jgi:hypothetical protein